MPHGARRVVALAITAVVAGTALAGVTSATAAPADCTDLDALKGSALSSCIAALSKQADAAGRKALIADEQYNLIRRKAEDAAVEAKRLDSAAAEAAVVAVRSRARAGAVAAQIARSNGSVGPTTEVLLSGDGASKILYHLSRMSELSTDTGTLAAIAKEDQRKADDLSERASAAADRLVAREQSAKDAYDEAEQASDDARMLVAKAREKQTPGSNAVNVQAYENLPSDASVTEKVLAFARAQIGKPYVFGAAGPASWDCSGLTMAAFQATGKEIGGHGVNVQYQKAAAEGLLLPYSAAQPGDLVFFGSGDFYHVAIYSGGGNMVEAPMPGRLVREVPVRTQDLAPVVARFTG